MQERKLDDAAATLCKALAADPKLREAAYEFAQIAFKKREYAQARDQLKLLFGETEAAQLIKFEIFLTFLLEGKDSRAQQMMDQFKFTGETPALYYAQAAWAFRHADPERGNGWVDSARRIYSAALNIVFADSFYDLGWLENRPEERTLATTANLAPELPASSPSWTPGMLLSMNGWSASPAQTLETVTIFPGTVPSFTLLAPPNDPGANQKGAFSTFAPP